MNEKNKRRYKHELKISIIGLLAYVIFGVGFSICYGARYSIWSIVFLLPICAGIYARNFLMFSYMRKGMDRQEAYKKAMRNDGDLARVLAIWLLILFVLILPVLFFIIKVFRLYETLDKLTKMENAKIYGEMIIIVSVAIFLGMAVEDIVWRKKEKAFAESEEAALNNEVN